MDFGLLAPALVGAAMVIVGAIILAWMNAHKPTLELPQPEEAAKQPAPFDFDRAGKQSNYVLTYLDQQTTKAH